MSSKENKHAKEVKTESNPDIAEAMDVDKPPAEANTESHEDDNPDEKSTNGTINASDTDGSPETGGKPAFVVPNLNLGNTHPVTEGSSPATEKSVRITVPPTIPSVEGNEPDALTQPKKVTEQNKNMNTENDKLSGFSEEPPEPFNPSGNDVFLGKFETVAWHKSKGKFLFINKYGPRSHAMYRLQDYAQENIDVLNPPENLNAALHAYSQFRTPGQPGPDWPKATWRHIEAVAWKTEFFGFDRNMSIPEVLEKEVKVIRPLKGKTLPTIMVLNVWERKNSEGRPERRYGWETKSKTSAFSNLGRWSAYYTALKQIYRHQEFVNKVYAGRDVTPEGLLAAAKLDDVSEKAFRDKVRNLEKYRTSTAPESAEEDSDQDSFVEDDETSTNSDTSAEKKATFVTGHDSNVDKLVRDVGNLQLQMADIPTLKAEVSELSVLIRSLAGKKGRKKRS